MSKPKADTGRNMIPAPVLLDERVPRQWDGRHLHWYGWEDPLTGFLCANNSLLSVQPCPLCGRPWLPWWNRGLDVSGRLSVTLERCGLCGFTLASEFDASTGMSHEWILDESDYPASSRK